jgi:DNA-directed RNA polymerase specialized sigma24 family protein
LPLDADDIARLYGTHARPLVAYFARRTFDPQAATELMAETFAEAVADRRKFRGGRNAAAAGDDLVGRRGAGSARAPA